MGWLWTLRQEEGYHLFGTTEHTLTGAPFGWEQGNALNLQWLLTYYPAYLASLVWDEVVAYNLTILSGLVLSSLAMYVLVRRLGCGSTTAFWAGLVYMLFPWHIWRINAGHASLVHLEVLPLLLLALHEWAARPTRTRVLLVGATTAAAWLASGYWGAMAVVGALAFALAVWAFWARPLGLRRASTRLAAVSAAVLAGSAIVGLLSIPGRQAGGITITRSRDDLSSYGARPAEFLAPDAENPFLGALASALRPEDHGGNPSESTLFLGWLTVALALAWVVTLVRLRRRLARPLLVTSSALAAVVVAGLAFAAPSPVGFAGRLIHWTPSWLLFQVLSEIRVPSRFVALVATGLVPLAALSLHHATAWLGQRAGGPPRRRLVAGAVVAGACALSVVELFPNVSPGTDADRLPAQYEAVRRTPEGVLVEYPVGEGLDYQFWQRLHGRPLLNGGRAGTTAGDVLRQLTHPAAPGTPETLALLGVTAIVTQPDALDYRDAVPDTPDADWGPGYALIERFADGSSVWQVVARPASALVVLGSPTFGWPEAPREGFVGHRLERPGTIELHAREEHVARVSLEADTPAGGRTSLRIEGAGEVVEIPVSGRSPVSFTVHVPRGHSSLAVSAGRPDVRLELSAPAARQMGGEAMLRATRISEDPGF